MAFGPLAEASLLCCSLSGAVVKVFPPPLRPMCRTSTTLGKDKGWGKRRRALSPPYRPRRKEIFPKAKPRPTRIKDYCGVAFPSVRVPRDAAKFGWGIESLKKLTQEHLAAYEAERRD